MSTKRIVSKQELADYFKCSYYTIVNMEKKGYIKPCIKTSFKFVRYDLDECIASLQGVKHEH